MYRDSRIFNVVCTDANTEYDLLLPLNTLVVQLQCRGDAHAIRVAIQDGDTDAARPYVTVKGSQPWVKLYSSAGRQRTLHVASANAGAVLEIIAYN